MNLSDRIYELRKKNGLSQEQFAEQLGVSRQSVSKWESEQSFPEIDKITSMAELFNVSTDYLLNGIEENKKAVVNWARVLPVLATCLNYIGFILFIFDRVVSWNINPIAMTRTMVAAKTIYVILLLLGTTVELLSQNKLHYKDIRKFLMINIFAYAGIVSMIIYLLNIPPLWRVMAYLLIVFITEICLIKKKC